MESVVDPNESSPKKFDLEKGDTSLQLHPPPALSSDGNEHPPPSLSSVGNEHPPPSLSSDGNEQNLDASNVKVNVSSETNDSITKTPVIVEEANVERI